MQIDQQSVKYLMQQRVGTPLQQIWIAKILGYDFIVEYKQKRENKVPDTLSWKLGFKKERASTSWLEKLMTNYAQDPKMQ